MATILLRSPCVDVANGDFAILFSGNSFLDAMSYFARCQLLTGFAPLCSIARFGTGALGALGQGALMLMWQTSVIKTEGKSRHSQRTPEASPNACCALTTKAVSFCASGAGPERCRREATDPTAVGRPFWTRLRSVDISGRVLDAR